MNDTWRTAHIYLHNHAATISDLVVRTIAPAVESSAPEDWHFVRYWWGGPHLRVRVRGARADWIDRIRSEVPAAEMDLDAERFAQEFTSTSPVEWHPHGAIDVDVPYEPEVARYGGEDAIALSERVFTDTSRVAVALLADRPDSAALRLIATDAMTLAMHALELDGHGAAISARRYFGTWDFVSEQRTNGPEARRAAEDTFDVDPERWARRRSAVTQSAARNPDQWRGVLLESFSVLATEVHRLGERGGSANGLTGVLWSHVHMFCNRLGIPISDERIAAWLTGLMSADSTDRVFFDDRSSAPDRRYLRASAYRRSRMHLDQMPRFDASSSPWSRRADAHRLPPPADVPQLSDVLVRRRSRYGSYGHTMTETTMSSLLRLAVGEVPRHPAFPVRPPVLCRTYPSASAAFAVDTFIIARSIDGLRPGCYRYVASDHALERWIDAPADHELFRWSPSFTAVEGPQLAVEHETVPAIVVLAPRLDELRAKYGQRALRLAFLEAGHMSQNVLLAATALGLPSVPLSSFDDDAVNECLHLDGAGSFAAAVIPVGAPSFESLPDDPGSRGHD